jgi:hypothetical protein
MARKIVKAERYTGYCILLALVVIAGGVLTKQFEYNPAILRPAEFKSAVDGEQPSSSTIYEGLARFVPEGMVVLSPPETFGPENLSDKINGKAELYLSAGFRQLHAQRFSISENPQAWQEIFVYDMGSPRGSFAVYSLQKRFDVEELDLGVFGYRTENALFFVHGQYYVEMVASVTQERMAGAMLAFARVFIEDIKTSQENLKEIGLFPPENLVKESISLIPADGFGYHRFDSIFTAQYALAETEMLAFLSQRKSPSEADELVQSYYQFLLANGGTAMESGLEGTGARMVEIFGTYEIFFNQASMLAGVHGAENKEAATRLARMLRRRLFEVAQ